VSQPTVELEVEVIHTSEKALLVRVEGHDDPVWMARSAVHEDSEVDCDADVGDKGTLIIPKWLAVEKGLEEGA
jgi:hypothetical protein